MRDLLNRYIDWDSISDLDQEKYLLDIGGASFNKKNETLTIELTLNFIVPFYNDLEMRAAIINASQGVRNVEFKYNYKDLILSDERAIELYLPYMIKMANGEFRTITESILEKDSRLEGDCVYIKALGDVFVKKLNENVSSLFAMYIKDLLNKEYRVVFEKDEEAKLSIEQTLEKQSQEDGRPVEPPKVVKPANSKNENAGSEKTEANKETPAKPKKKKNDFFAMRREKELPVVGNVIMGGKAVVGEILPLNSLNPNMAKVATGGIVFDKEARVLESEKVLVKLLISDKVDSMELKIFVSENKWNDIDSHIKIGDYIKVMGQPKIDTFEGEKLVFWPNRIEKGEIEEKKDLYPGPHRVELHCHTKMSMLDGLNDVESIIKKAAKWNQPAVAITDHGVVQSFPDAASIAKKLSESGTPIKVIYGMEGYVFDDSDCITEEGEIDYKKNKTNHIILLASTQEGVKNLYKLVSLSHLKYFYRSPRLPRSVIEKYRKGLIIGSACEAGEVYQAAFNGVSDSELDRIASFYDYLEIQPLINNRFMIEKGMVGGNEDLRNLNRRIIECGKRLGKPVCATTDAHYDEPESAVFRNVLLGSRGFDNAENGQGLYLRTTDEMMEEFSYIGEETAYEVVVANTNLIAEMVEEGIKPIPSGKFPPEIKGADDTLRKTCMEKAVELYGDPLPKEIQDRLSVELESIISNNYSVMYVSAQMLVNKSLEDGYMVGSRGSVGSSLVATLAGITEVNPLDPHYRCPSCKKVIWGERADYDCGLDMPDMSCPNCGTEMIKDGFTIPFATFLGFDGTKEPDIDLNFAGEYQSTAHKYVGEIFGEKNVFKAGTVSTLEKKNTERLVTKFTEKTGLNFSAHEAKRIAMGCLGVKNTTGQHPGGIIIVPDDHEIYEFCPVQHPANKDVDIITTHFDYHKLEKNLLKLDILGHTGPSMLRHLYDMTGVNPISVDITDKDVLSIFTSTDALDIKDPEYRYTDGTFGVPEFGTDFVRNMLREIKPTRIADLVRIAGFSHGTDVWRNNAQDYINDGVATMNEVISTRDDIMNYLILKGLDNKDAFDIMEDVRKNRPLKPNQIQMMKDHGVPDWYVESCEKIQYMFPRAHAAAYVLTSMRMAWYKVHRPREFYAAQFTASIDGFETAVIMQGAGVLDSTIRRIEGKGDYDPNFERREKDKKTKPVFELAYEMYARGYEFSLPILGKSRANKFIVEDGKILLPYSALEGVGASAAEALASAYDDRPFDTVEDAINRAKINKTAVEALKTYGVFKGLPEMAQISFFA